MFWRRAGFTGYSYFRLWLAAACQRTPSKLSLLNSFLCNGHSEQVFVVRWTTFPSKKERGYCCCQPCRRQSSLVFCDVQNFPLPLPAPLRMPRLAPPHPAPPRLALPLRCTKLRACLHWSWDTQTVVGFGAALFSVSFLWLRRTMVVNCPKTWRELFCLCPPTERLWSVWPCHVGTWVCLSLPAEKGER